MNNLTDLAKAAGWTIGDNAVWDARKRVLATKQALASMAFDADDGIWRSAKVNGPFDEVLHALLAKYLHESREIIDEYRSVLDAEETRSAKARAERRDPARAKALARSIDGMLQRIDARLPIIEMTLMRTFPPPSPAVVEALTNEAWALSSVRTLLVENAKLRDALAEADVAGSGVPPTMWRKMIQLTHPDVHPEGRKELAHEVSMWLTNHRAAASDTDTEE